MGAMLPLSAPLLFLLADFCEVMLFEVTALTSWPPSLGSMSLTGPPPTLATPPPYELPPPPLLAVLPPLLSGPFPLSLYTGLASINELSALLSGPLPSEFSPLLAGVPPPLTELAAIAELPPALSDFMPSLSEISPSRTRALPLFTEQAPISFLCASSVLAFLRRLISSPFSLLGHEFAGLRASLLAPMLRLGSAPLMQMLCLRSDVSNYPLFRCLLLLCVFLSWVFLS